MNIKFVKLISGEEVLSEVEEDGGEVTLVRPMILSVDPRQQGLRLMDWLILAAQKELTISKDKIIFIATAVRDLLPVLKARAFRTLAIWLFLSLKKTDIWCFMKRRKKCENIFFYQALP